MDSSDLVSTKRWRRSARPRRYSDRTASSRSSIIAALPFVHASDSGVTADLCRTHGLWLDDGELGSILEYLKRNEAF